MDNYSGPGDSVTITAAAAITTGQLVAAGPLIGVAQNAAASGASVVLAIEGVFLLPKAAGVMTMGDKLDFDLSAVGVGKAITPASGDVEDFGIAMETVVTGATHILVKLLPGVGAVT